MIKVRIATVFFCLAMMEGICTMLRIGTVKVSGVDGPTVRFWMR